MREPRARPARRTHFNIGPHGKKKQPCKCSSPLPESSSLSSLSAHLLPRGAQACKFTPPGGEVTVTFGLADDDVVALGRTAAGRSAMRTGGRSGRNGGSSGGGGVVSVAVSVTDTGCGIALDLQQNILQPFSQAGPT